MDRTKFFQKVSVNGIEQLDYLWNTLSSFKVRRTPIYYKTNIHDVGQPDLISYTNYGTERYWWIICLVNGIQNPFTDITIGMILKIPSILDIADFYTRYRLRR